MAICNIMMKTTEGKEMDIENHMVIGAADAYEGKPDLTFSERVAAYKEYLLSEDGHDELYNWMLEREGFHLMLRYAVDCKGPVSVRDYIEGMARNMAGYLALNDGGELSI